MAFGNHLFGRASNGAASTTRVASFRAAHPTPFYRRAAGLWSLALGGREPFASDGAAVENGIRAVRYEHNFICYRASIFATTADCRRLPAPRVDGMALHWRVTCELAGYIITVSEV